jgi:putative salt-induced outer membrane protein
MGALRKETTMNLRLEPVKRMAVVLGILLAVLQMASGAFAQGEQKKKWSDQAEFTLVDTGGNTDVTTIAGKNTLKYDFTDKWIASWVIGGLYSKDHGIRTAERYYSDLRLDYLYTDRLYFYGLAGWLKDTFAGIDNRYYGGPGAGYKFLTGPRHFLLGELGLNYAKEDYTDGTDGDFLQGRAFGQYAWAFTDKTRFSQDLEFLYDFSDSENYGINSITALTTALNSFLSLKASYTIRYDNEPVPDNLRKTDTILAIALVVNY